MSNINSRKMRLAKASIAALFLLSISCSSSAQDETFPPPVERQLVPRNITAPSGQTWVTGRDQDPRIANYYAEWTIRFRYAAEWHRSDIDPSKFQNAVLSMPVSPDGTLGKAEFLRSTGSASLDAWIIEAAGRIPRMSKPPESLVSPAARLQVVALVGFHYGSGSLRPSATAYAIAEYRFQRSVVAALQTELSKETIPERGSVVLELDVSDGVIAATRIAAPSGSSDLDALVLRTANLVARIHVAPMPFLERMTLHIPLDLEP